MFVELAFFALFMTVPFIYKAFGFVSVRPVVIGLVVICGYIMRPIRLVSSLHLESQSLLFWPNIYAADLA